MAVRSLADVVRLSSSSGAHSFVVGALLGEAGTGSSQVGKGVRFLACR